MTIDEILRPEDVILTLRATDKTSAVDEVLAQLHGDPRVKDWEALRATIVERDAPALFENGIGICIAHGRTPAVSELVFAAGRSAAGVDIPGLEGAAQFFFVAGIPSAMTSDYLRLVGAIARVCRSGKETQRLLAAADGESFVEILVEATERLD